MNTGRSDDAKTLKLPVQRGYCTLLLVQIILKSRNTWLLFFTFVDYKFSRVVTISFVCV